MSSSDTKRDLETGSDGLPRIADLVGASLGLVVLSPVMLLVAWLVRLSSPGPVLFRQERVGRRGEPFTLLKFRSMRQGVAGVQITAAGDPRVTPVGRWLRRWKLDELPSLWNVVRGEMSLVGPRPEVPRFVDAQNPEWILVLGTRPGLTDPVTAILRNEDELLDSVEDLECFYREVLQPYKLKLYGEYLSSRSIRSDAAVLIRTALAVLLPKQTPPPTREEIQALMDTHRGRSPIRTPDR
jgi:lipopolysaccharide/colanic/teichoic acid biosynthesis glycosyltransferase